MDAAEIHSKKDSMRKVILPKQGEFIFPIVDGRPIQGENNIDFLTIFGPCREASYAAITLNPELKFCSPREESFRIPLKYIDATRTTHTNLDVKQEKRIDDCWKIDESRDLSDPWTGFTIYSVGSKSSRRIHVVRCEIDEKTAYIQARSFVPRALEVNGKAHQAEGEAKVVQ